MRASDVVLAFPQIILALLAVTAIGPKLWLIVLVVAIGHVPRVARVIRGAAQEVVERDFVQAAEAVGEKRSRIVFGELLPNVTSPLLVELGLRMTFSIGLIAAVSFLGFGLQPPTSDWGLMINENRLSITVQQWAVLLPVLAIGFLTIGTNLITDGIARAAIGIDRKSDAMSNAVEVRDLRIELVGRDADVVDEITLAIEPGEVLGLVGESGSGKTTVGMALLGHVRRGGRVGGGAVVIDGRDLSGLDAGGLRGLRGGTVAYIPQDPGTSLNPALRLRTQLREMLDAHPARRSDEERDARMREALEEVALPSDDTFLARYPHQLSGGQQQRVAIAMAFACRPNVIVCDEPTTGLDVTTQARVLETVRDLCRSHSVAALYVSHDLAVVAELADRVAVMYAGRIVEVGTRDQLFGAARHPYTRRLLRAVPDLEGKRAVVGIPGFAPLPGRRPDGCFFEPRCALATDECRSSFPPAFEFESGHRARCYHADEAVREVPVEGGVEEVHVAARAGAGARDPRPRRAPRRARTRCSGSSSRCTATSAWRSSASRARARRRSRAASPGCTRTTRARSAWATRSSRRRRARAPAAARKQIQYVFQNPYASLNPRRTVGQTIARQLELFFPGHKDMSRRVGECLERVALSASAVAAYPDELSGGERQRVAIARALAAEPDLMVCDEITSALDVSVQAAIIDLLRELRTEMGLSLLFITHNLALIRTIADRVAVMTEGGSSSSARPRDVLERPSAPYTQQLLANTPSIAAGRSLNVLLIMVDQLAAQWLPARPRPRSQGWLARAWCSRAPTARRRCARLRARPC